MIVITTLDTRSHKLFTGSRFQLTVTQESREISVIDEKVTRAGTVDFCASFRFVREDGTCIGNHFCGIFGNQVDLPEEIKNAKQVQDLTPMQRENFFNSINIKI